MKSASPIEAQAADWIARRDGDAWSESQQLELDAWLDETTAHRVAYLRLESVWRRADRLSSLHAPGRPSVPRKSQPLSRFSTWRIAVGIFIVIAAGIFVAYKNMAEEQQNYVTAIGDSKTVALKDGSVVVLNTDTHLHAQISGGQRTVKLDAGEAYFEIAHDPKHPFVVEAGNSRVTVLGTKFSVRREADHVTVMVVDGRVQVSGTVAAGTAVITKNDMIVADNGKMQLTKKTAEDVANELSWRRGLLVFNQMTLEQAAKEFNRYNHKKLVVETPAAAKIRIDGGFNVHNIESFARLLHEGFGLKIETVGDEIKIIG